MGTPAYVTKLRERLAGIDPPPLDQPFVLLITGSSNAEWEVWAEPMTLLLGEVDRWLFDHGRAKGWRVMRHGGAKGIDTIAHSRARRFGYAIDRMPADWRHWGRRSGIIRNGQMVAKSPRPYLCLAFFAGRTAGTADCAAQARAAGIPTVAITTEDLYLPHAQ